MSKKKRAKRENHQEMEVFGDVLRETLENAIDFIESATPFEISSTLAELGVSTTHRSGIEQFLSSWQPPAEDPEPIAPFEALAEHWISEVERKRGDTLDLEDDVLLTEIARSFWIKLTSGKNQGPA